MMKKKYMILIVIISVALAAGVMLMATQGGLTITDAVGAEGEIVYLTVSLEKSCRGNSMGFEYSYDSSLLELQPEKCYWMIDGVISDFSVTNPQGVWAVEDPMKLNGDICVLAFRIYPTAVFEKTQVECTLTIKNGQKEVDRISAEGTITASCQHDYSVWASTGEDQHSRTCDLCGRIHSQAHIWDTGKAAVREGGDEESVWIVTCAVCAHEKQVNSLSELEEKRGGTSYLPDWGVNQTHDHEEQDETDAPGSAPERATEPSANNEHDHWDYSNGFFWGSGGSGTESTESAESAEPTEDAPVSTIFPGFSGWFR